MFILCYFHHQTTISYNGAAICVHQEEEMECRGQSFRVTCAMGGQGRRGYQPVKFHSWVHERIKKKKGFFSPRSSQVIFLFHTNADVGIARGFNEEKLTLLEKRCGGGFIRTFTNALNTSDKT